MLKALTGKDVEISENEEITISGPVEEAYWGARGSFKLGVIPSLEKEIRYYAGLKAQTGIKRIEKLMNKYIIQTDYKLKAAKDLLRYTIQPYERRVRKNSHRADVNSEEDWRKVAAMIRSFIIN